MTFMRRVRLRFAVLSLLGMLFAQWSVAAYGCMLPGSAQGAATVATAECDEHPAAAPSPLCSRHCVGDQGGSAANAAALLAPPADNRAVLCLPSVHPEQLQIGDANAPWPGHPPPLLILLQRFLI